MLSTTTMRPIGNYVNSSQMNQIKKALEALLSSIHYQPKPSETKESQTPGPTAYAPEALGVDEAPVLLDSNVPKGYFVKKTGEVVDEFDYDFKTETGGADIVGLMFRPALKVVIRDTQGDNNGLHRTVRQLIQAQGIHNLVDGAQGIPQGTTKVYSFYLN